MGSVLLLSWFFKYAYVLLEHVANGSLELNGETLPAWSMVYVESSEDAFEIEAGRHGLEALVMQFPRDDD